MTVKDLIRELETLKAAGVSEDPGRGRRSPGAFGQPAGLCQESGTGT